MSKITKNQRINQIADQLARQQGVISKLTIMVKEQNEAILMLEKLTDEKLRDQPEPQLKQLDQSVFDGLDERWVAASVEENGIVRLYLSDESNPYDCEYHLAGTKYDTTDWQNSLIERDVAEELTGSDLARAMLARGDKCVMIRMGARDDKQARDIGRFAIATGIDESGRFNVMSDQQPISKADFAIPINNQGEPLTAAEAGF